MKLNVLRQPFHDSDYLYAVLKRWARNPQVLRIDIAVAWAKRGGLQPLREDLLGFRDRGGRLRLLVGISHGGATIQGLEMAMELADEAYVFHHSDRRTFHPKLYLARGRGVRLAVVGSQNLTGGGLSTNFEVGCELEFDPSDDSDAAAYAELRRAFDELLERDGAAIRLTAGLIGELANTPRYRIGNEDDRPSDGSGGGDGDEAQGNDPLFTADSSKLRRGPVSNGRRQPAAASKTSSGPGVSRRTTTASVPSSSMVSPADVVRRWSKKMSAADAQHPRGRRTNPTGHLTLVQGGHPIDQTSWFRDHFFGTQNWETKSVRRRAKEHATVQFTVAIDGKPFGRHELLLSHTPGFEANQGNRTTVLHWGEVVGAHLKAVDYTGKTISLENLGDGSFRLTIADLATGPFRRGQ